MKNSNFVLVHNSASIYRNTGGGDDDTYKFLLDNQGTKIITHDYYGQDVVTVSKYGNSKKYSIYGEMIEPVFNEASSEYKKNTNSTNEENILDEFNESELNEDKKTFSESLKEGQSEGDNPTASFMELFKPIIKYYWKNVLYGFAGIIVVIGLSLKLINFFFENNHEKDIKEHKTTIQILSEEVQANTKEIGELFNKQAILKLDLKSTEKALQDNISKVRKLEKNNSELRTKIIRETEKFNIKQIKNGDSMVGLED